MRIKKIDIRSWRNFRNVSIELPDDASLVCLVGANGTGKTHVLELISACAHQVGLSSGIELPRGNPLADTGRDFSVEFYLARRVSGKLDGVFYDPEVYNAWDRTIRFEGQTSQLVVGGIDEGYKNREFAQQVVQQLRQSPEVHYLFLDADRAYPRRDLPAHEMAQAFEAQWHSSEWNKTRSFATTKTLYEE